MKRLLFVALVLAGGVAAALYVNATRLACDATDKDCVTQTAVTDLIEMRGGSLSGSAPLQFSGAALWRHMSDAQKEAFSAPVRDSFSHDGLIAQFEDAAGDVVLRGADMAMLTAALDEGLGARPGFTNRRIAALADEILRADAAAMADLVIGRQPELVNAGAVDSVLRTVMWIARNDPKRMRLYLETYPPIERAFFRTAGSLYTIAAEDCAIGPSIARVARAEMAAQNATEVAQLAYPVELVLRCDGPEAAEAQIEEMFALLDGKTPTREEVEAVNVFALAPMMMHYFSQQSADTAYALAARGFSEDGSPIDEGAASRLHFRAVGHQLDQPGNLDSVRSVRWFVEDWEEGRTSAPERSGVDMVPHILNTYPDPMAIAARLKALDWMAKGDPDDGFDYHIAHLKIGTALIDARRCALGDRQLKELLAEATGVRRRNLRLMVTGLYLDLLDLHDPALPACD